MKKIIINLILLFLLLSTQVQAYEDSNVTAKNYNAQGALALSHAKKSTGLQKRLYLKEAKWFYQHSVAVYDDNFDGFLGLARTYMYLGRFDKAYTNMMIAYNFNKTSPLVNYYMGEYSFLNDKFVIATEFYKEAMKLGYSNHYETLHHLGLCYDKLGDTKNALHYYHKCLKIKPDNKEIQQKISEIENKDSKYKNYYDFY